MLQLCKGIDADPAAVMDDKGQGVDLILVPGVAFDEDCNRVSRQYLLCFPPAVTALQLTWRITITLLQYLLTPVVLLCEFKNHIAHLHSSEEEKHTTTDSFQPTPPRKRFLPYSVGISFDDLYSYLVDLQHQYTCFMLNWLMGTQSH